MVDHQFVMRKLLRSQHQEVKGFSAFGGLQSVRDLFDDPVSNTRMSEQFLKALRKPRTIPFAILLSAHSFSDLQRQDSALGELCGGQRNAFLQ